MTKNLLYDPTILNKLYITQHTKKEEQAIRKRPMLILACAFLAGCMHGYAGILILIPVILSLIYENRKKITTPHRTILAFIVLVLIFLISAGHMRQAEKLCLAYQSQLTEGENVAVCGILEKKEFKNQTYRYYLNHTSVRISDKIYPCKKTIVYCKEDTCGLGDLILADGEICLYEGARNEGMFDMRGYYYSQQIGFAVFGDKITLIRKAAFPLREKLHEIREVLSGSLMEYAISENSILREEDAGVLISMLLGDKSALGEELKELYQMAGISHILAISGMHVSLIGMSLYQIIKRSGGGFVGSGALSALAVSLYACMTGNALSTQRAAGMLFLTMAGAVFGRQTDLLNSLSVMVIVLLWENPFLTGNSSFLFSVTAVVGIAVSAKVFSLDAKHGKKKLLESIALTGTTLPLVCWYYFEIPLYGVLANILLLPLLGVLFFFGLTGMILVLFSYRMAGLFLIPAAFCLRFYEMVCKITLTLPIARITTGRPESWQIVLYYLTGAGGLGIIWTFWKYKEDNFTKTTLPSVRIIMVLLCLFILNAKPVPGAETDFLDVGQGDAVFLSAGDGKTIFFDGGSTSEKEAGLNRILPFLKSRKVRSVDYWFVSHTDDDHVSGLMEILQENYTIRTLVLSAYIPQDEKWHQLVTLAEDKGTNVVYLRAGDQIRTGGSCLTCIYPDAEAVRHFRDVNDLSLAICYEDTSLLALFAGDLSEKGEELLIKNYLQLCAKKLITGEGISLYKVNHHGSKYSSSAALLQTIRPDVAVISCARKNRYGHPGQETIDRLKDAGTAVYYTMESGQIRLRKSENVFYVEFPMKKALD